MRTNIMHGYSAVPAFGQSYRSLPFLLNRRNCKSRERLHFLINFIGICAVYIVHMWPCDQRIQVPLADVPVDCWLRAADCQYDEI